MSLESSFSGLPVELQSAIAQRLPMRDVRTLREVARAPASIARDTLQQRKRQYRARYCPSAQQCAQALRDAIERDDPDTTAVLCSVARTDPLFDVDTLAALPTGQYLQPLIDAARTYAPQAIRALVQCGVRWQSEALVTLTRPDASDAPRALETLRALLDAFSQQQRGSLASLLAAEYRAPLARAMRVDSDANARWGVAVSRVLLEYGASIAQRSTLDSNVSVAQLAQQALERDTDLLAQDTRARRRLLRLLPYMRLYAQYATLPAPLRRAYHRAAEVARATSVR